MSDDDYKAKVHEKLEQKRSHVASVRKIAGGYIDMIRDQVSHHDEDKISRLEAGVLEKDMNHYSSQRHHWWATNLYKMDLVDAIEACSDMVAVARARGGMCEIPLMEPAFSNQAVRSLLENTIHRMDPSIKVKFFDAATYEF